MKKKLIIMIIILTLIISIVILTKTNKPQGKLLELNYENIIEKINNKDDFILVISQSKCINCATYKPRLTNIAKNYNLNIYYIDIDFETEKNAKKLLKDFNLSGATPTTIFIKDGKEKGILNRIEGSVSEKKAIEKFKKMGFIEE